MDIRKWFTSPKSNSASASRTVTKKDSKSEKSESIQKKSSKLSKKRRIIESDSDDEDPIPKEEKKDVSNKKHNKKQDMQEKGNSDKSVPQKKKEVSVADFFGSVPVSRGPKEEAHKKKKIKDEEIHEDDDFQATLAQLNEVKASKDKKVNGQSTPSNKTSTNPHMFKSDETKEITRKDKEPPMPENKKASSKEKSPSGKRKSKNKSNITMEITPSEKKPASKIIVKEEKPPPKKPRSSGGNYQSYLNREGPKALGSKEIPEGEDGCLDGLTFVITGVLESMERDEAKSLVEKYGGKVMTTISKKTKYIVIGRDAGASKLDKAEKFGTTQLDEDGLLDLIRTMPGKGGSVKSKPTKPDKTPATSSSVGSGKSSGKESSSEKIAKEDDDFLMNFDDDSTFSENELSFCDAESKSSNLIEKSSPVKEKSTDPIKKEKISPIIKEPKKENNLKETKLSDIPSSMWVDKYKPTNLKQIIGQQGDKSNAKKLLHWLVNWHKSRKLKKKPIPGRFNPSDDGSAYKAALLSGPPGVGKTTTTTLVCKEAGFDYFELNASDTRSKKNLQQEVSQLLGNQTLANCFKDNGKVSQNHVIVMDEVDGMGGNEDRGGMLELISFIKASKVPIICICNDRNHPKIRSLSNYCFDLRFQRPRVEQIKAAMMSIAFKEHVDVSPEVLQDVIVASNQDIRQVLHSMSMWSAKSKTMSSAQTKSDIGYGIKHIKMGPFDVLREVFAIGNNPKATIMDKSALFFHDYSMAPLFVQENYLHVVPTAAGGDTKKHLTLLSEAADSICIGDIIDKQIRARSSWNLLPTQAIFASVVPGELLSGYLRQMINFPAWLGKFSNERRMDRILQELHVHMRMRITGNKTDVALDYLPLLKRALTTPLIQKEQEGVPEVLKTMEEYYLLREDFDSIIDLSLWPGQTDPRTKIQTKVKSAFTRAYNKESGKNPYAITKPIKKKASAKEVNDMELGEEDIVESEEDDDESIEKDAMIKVKKPSKKNAAEVNEPSTSSKGKKSNPSKRGRAK